MYTQQLSPEQESLIRQRFPRLTGEDVESLDGACDKLVDAVQDRYALNREEAERRVDEFCSSIDRAGARGSAAARRPERIEPDFSE